MTDRCARCRRRFTEHVPRGTPQPPGGTAGGLCRRCITEDQAAARGWLRVTPGDRTNERWWHVCKERGIPYGRVIAYPRWHYVTFDTWSAPYDSDGWRDTADLRKWAFDCAARHAFAHGRRKAIWFSDRHCSAVHPDISERLADAIAASWHGDTVLLRAFIAEHAHLLVPDDPRHLVEID